jgi:hypothetical protein
VANRKSNNNLRYGISAIVAAVVILILILLVKSPTTTNTTSGSVAAPASLLEKVTSIKDSVFDAIGLGTATSNLPKKVSAPALTSNGKPRVLYVGAEYCPYCATERWAMIAAFSKFGTFTGIKETHSSSTDVYPNTQTFSFYKSSYSSPYIEFDTVETYSNVAQGTGYVPLQSPTSEEQALMNKYDAPPYQSSAGGIPFIDFGGKYLISGVTYSPAVLQGKTYSQIADALSDPNSAIAKGAIGAANAMIAAICSITNNQPSNVCSSSTIQSIETTINGG